MKDVLIECSSCGNRVYDFSCEKPTKIMIENKLCPQCFRIATTTGLKRCKNCGINFETAHITFDGYSVPYITIKCVKERYICEEQKKTGICWTCCLDGGHIKELYSTGRHRWYLQKLRITN